jgi:hypothetical protein
VSAPKATGGAASKADAITARLTDPKGFTVCVCVCVCVDGWVDSVDEATAPMRRDRTRSALTSLGRAKGLPDAKSLSRQVGRV